MSNIEFNIRWFQIRDYTRQIDLIVYYYHCFIIIIFVTLLLSTNPQDTNLNNYMTREESQKGTVYCSLTKETLKCALTLFLPITVNREVRRASPGS